MTSTPAQDSPCTARQPASGRDLGGPTRPNLDFSDDGWGPFLHLTPVPKKEQERMAPRTCCYIADNTASPLMKCNCESRADISTATKDDGQKFMLPCTLLRLVPVVRESAATEEGVGLVGEVEKVTEKAAEKEQQPALQAAVVAVP